jgi:hypothetical protein
MSYRSWSDCWLRLVVRYVNDEPSQNTHCCALSMSDPGLHLEGYHVPAVRHRDAFYTKLEDERSAALGQK